MPKLGTAIETCRLCGATLTLSLDNPRRVCAQCGEINLPSDVALSEVAPPPRAAPRPVQPAPPRPIDPWIGRGLTASVLPALVGAVGSAVLEAIQRPRGGLMSGFDFVGPALLVWLVANVVAFLVLVGLIARERPAPWRALGFWLFGQFLGVFVFLFGSLFLLNVRHVLWR